MRVNSKVLSFKGTLNTFKSALNLALLSLLVSACGGGGGAGNSSTASLSDTTAPTVLSTDPANRSRSVAARAPISVTFSEVMDASSLTATTFVVSAGGTPIPGAMSVTRNSATFTPTVDLDMNTLYTASITTGAKDSAGNALAAAYNWQFTPGTRVWSTARSMATDAFSPQTGTDSAGNLILVWQQKEGNNYSIWANRYDAVARQWGLATLLQTGNTGSGYAPQLTVNASGHAVAVWQHYDGSRYHVWANHYNALIGQWGVAQALTGSASDAFEPQVAISANGNALVVWRGQDGPYDDPATTLVAGEYYVSSLWAKHYNAGTKIWEPAATALETDNLKGRDASAARVVMDSSGNGVVVWQQFNGTVTSVYATRYTAGTWAISGAISTGSAGVAVSPQIAMDDGGNAIAVWRQYDANARYSIWARRYVAATLAWGAPALVESDNSGDAFDPQLAVSAGGDAWVAWHQHDGAVYNIKANRYAVASDLWSSAMLIDSNNPGNAMHAQIAINASGDAFAVWEQSEGTRTSVWANRYNPSLQAWGTAALVEVDDSGDALAPQVNVNSIGNASAAWRQLDGAHWQVLTSRYQ